MTTLQMETKELFNTLQGFGGCWEDSSSEEADAADGTPADGIDGRDLNTDMLGLDIWPGALALCHYLSLNIHIVAQRNVLELGAGVGLPGLLAAKLGAHRPVVLTDYQSQVVGYYPTNVSLNGLTPEDVQGQVLDWTKIKDISPSLQESFHVLLAADAIYEERFVEPLINSIIALLNVDFGCVIMAHQTRRSLVIDQDRPFVLLLDGFVEQGLKCRLLGVSSPPLPEFPGPMQIIAIAHSNDILTELPVWNANEGQWLAV